MASADLPRWTMRVEPRMGVVGWFQVLGLLGTAGLGAWSATRAARLGFAGPDVAFTALFALSIFMLIPMSLLSWGVISLRRPRVMSTTDGYEVDAPWTRDQNVAVIVVLSLFVVVCFDGALLATHFGTRAIEPVVRVYCWACLLLFPWVIWRAIHTLRSPRILEFTPELVRFRRHPLRFTLRWEEITRIEREIPVRLSDSGRLLRPGSGFVLHTVDGRRYAMPLWLWSIDTNTLMHVVLTLHEHPEARESLGREEGRALFDGPTQRQLRRMRIGDTWAADRADEPQGAGSTTPD